MSKIRRIGASIFLSLSMVLSACAREHKLAENEPIETSRAGDVSARLDTSPSGSIAEELRASVHANVGCTGCHAGNTAPTTTATDEATQLGRASCARCHSQQVSAYKASIHAKLAAPSQSETAGCVGCHGDHDILPSQNPQSRVNGRNLSATCRSCHRRAKASEQTAGDPGVNPQHADSIHPIVGSSVSCVNCHGVAHEIRAIDDPEASVSRGKVARTCGRCHAEVERAYRLSEHAKALSRDGTATPTCSTCHAPHEITRSIANFRLRSDKICGQCHSSRRDRYLDTYHGRAHDLGDIRVAACYDCHGAHQINKASDPRSTINEANRVATCQKCHRQASANFAKFMPHADHRDQKHYPTLYWSFVSMTALLIVVFAFFGLHTLLWLYRSLRLYFSDPARFRELKHEARNESGATVYLRFRPVDRLCHSLLILSFMLLVLTGMPLRFHSAPWAQYFFACIGGPRAAGRLHRLGAVLTLGYFAIHLSSLVGPIRRARPQFLNDQGHFSLKRFFGFALGPDSPLPNFQDVRDFVAHTRWFIGKGPRPSFDRFTYWEKFDYFAVFWGVSVIGLSGLVMWFPLPITHLFPGWIINVAHFIHSDEALLAAGFIFTFHFFNSNFRPEKFPIDLVMFSGRVTESEMRRDRGRQYDRLSRSGQLDKLRIQDEWPSWKWLFGPLGAFAVVLGMVLAIAIFWAVIRHY